MKIFIYGNTYNLRSKKYIEILLRKLIEIKAEVQIFEPFYNFWKNNFNEIKPLKTFVSPDDVESNTDFMFSLGGDGTFLESVQYVRNKNIPIIGINMGRLGYLASITQEDIENSLNQIINNNYYLEERSLIHFTNISRLFKNFPYALNDVTVQKNDTSMITIHTFLNDEYLNSYWADGLIISTSTGSTAYSLSVGGPIILPSSRVFAISPIAPHNLSVRPVIVPENYNVRLKLESRSKNFLATIDNRKEVFEMDTEIELKTADFRISILHLNNYSFYNTIRNKLMWGIDKRN